MRRALLPLLIFLSLTAAPISSADDNPADYTTFLIPLVSHGLAGAHGSIWDSELYVFNGSHLPLRMPGFSDSPVLPIEPSIVIQPHVTTQVGLFPRDGVDGAFLYVPNTMVSTTKMSLRIRDTSQNATSLGDEVPIVRADQAAHELTIFDVPVDPKYRATLRIYGFTQAPMPVRVTIYPEIGVPPLRQFDVTLNGIVTAAFDPFPLHPAYIALDPLGDEIRSSIVRRVRIVITNFAPVITPTPPKIWAFVSLTNNETNQVTLVTPK
ncbi:MAG TPA: hypothetical protein VFV49_08225 [Thermoanaerobaculia bacterium]|nr:hypothetical protein [Thermoanaerobaculia bacterium]